ncbi:hypothetical protein ACFL5O_04015 [Myxococcota bacterium]
MRINAIAMVAMIFAAGCGDSSDGNDGTNSSAMSTGSEGGGAATGSGASDFEDACKKTADCSAPMDFCAIVPGETEGICTRQGCLDDPSLCPDQWDCLDLSAFEPGGPAFCVPPMEG